ncbi:MAG: ABC transporter ATP-binding protein [Actinomycetota bacterium]
MPNMEMMEEPGIQVVQPPGGAPSEPVISVAEVLRPMMPALIVACVLRAIAAVAALIPFLAVARAGEPLLSEPIDRDGVWSAVVLGVVALLVSIGCLMAANAVTHFADVNFQLSIRTRMARHLGRVPLGWFTARNSGQVKKSLQDDVSAMHTLAAHAAIDVVAAIVTPIATIVLLVLVDWRLALYTLVPVIVGVVLYSRQMSNYGDQMKAYQESLGRVNSAVVEFLTGIAVVKTFGQAQAAHERYTEETEGFADLFYDWVKGLLRLANITELVLSPLFSVIWILAGSVVFVANGWIEPVEALPFLLLGAAITGPINALGFAANELQVAIGAARNVGSLLSTPQLEAHAERGEPRGHGVRYRQVRFGYGAEAVLHDIDLDLAPGTVTALVGPSGSGKTTIARLLPRFWDPDEGFVSIGGVDVRAMDPRDLYRTVGFVFQDVQLLRATVAENIGLGRPEATRDEIIAAARAARIHDRIVELPNGYDTEVGADASFSGGEAQRVSIARMVLADTPVLVLDEATAFADPESESEIQDALAELAAGRTVLVIAHRLSTIVDVDQIVVLNEGWIEDRGRHGELIERSDTYRRLWRAYGGVPAEVASGGANATGGAS